MADLMKVFLMLKVGESRLSSYVVGGLSSVGWSKKIMWHTPSNEPSLLRIGLGIVCFCAFYTASAQTEIHKCTDADGGVVYSQVPCLPQKSVESEKTESDATVPQEEPKPDTNTSACKKRYRDAIDAIDAEISNEYSPDKSEEYKQRLLLLTRKLRQC
jgi:hypothetical protein